MDCFIGCLQSWGIGAIRAWEQSVADAARKRDLHSLRVAEVDLFKASLEFMEEQSGFLRVFRRKSEHEFVAAIAEDAKRRRFKGFEELPAQFKRVISRLIAMAVIDVFEVVVIKERQDEIGFFLAKRGKRFFSFSSARRFGSPVRASVSLSSGAAGPAFALSRRRWRPERNRNAFW